MTTGIGLLWTLAGLAALAGALFLLQRLRVRQRVVLVETTMFWRQALEDTRARTFVERFRHPWVYAFLLTIASALWLAFAGLRTTPSDERATLVLLDGSAHMARPGRFDATLALLEERLAGFDDETRSVVLCAGRARTLLLPGEHARLLRERLGDAGPEACPSTIERTLRAQLAEARAGLRVVIAGDSGPSQAFVDALPEGVEISRLAPPRAEGGARNRGITALGAHDARSGKWDQLDVLVEVHSSGVQGSDAQATGAPTLSLDGRALDVRAERATIGAGLERFVFRDLPARGGVLEVTLPQASGDEIALDDRAQLALPERLPLAVAIEDGLPAALTALVESDPALRLVTSDAQLVLRRAGSAFGGADARALELGAPDSQENAIEITCRADEDANSVLRELHGRLGIDEIDAARIARRSGRVVTMTAAPGAARRLAIWESLLSDEYDFVQSRAFPLFFALGLRWIAGDWAPPPSFRAGVPAQLGVAELRSRDGVVRKTLGDAFVAADAQLYHSETGAPLAASLLDRGVSSAAPASEVEDTPDESSWMRWRSFLLLLALALLGVEWVAYQRGRMP